MDETMAYLGTGRTLTYELIRAGVIPSVRLGRRIVVPKAALDRLLEGQNTLFSNSDSTPVDDK